MANQWYFARDSKTYGPYSAGQLRGLAATGQLRPRDAVWKEGMENRVAAARVKDLFTAAQLHPPAPPAADATPPPRPRAAEAAPDVTPEEIPDDVGLVPLADDAQAVDRKAPAGTAAEAAPAKAERPAPPHQPPSKRRVLGVKGGTLLGQDGTTVRFRKKCQKCGHDDSSVTSMQIPPGFLRVNFFCPKCKKSQQVEVHGVNF